MKQVLLSVLAGLMFCLQAHADVDLYSPLPQRLPPDVSQEVYQSLAKAVQEDPSLSKEMQTNCLFSVCQIELKNFYCESFETPLTKPFYTCSFGWKSQLRGESADKIYQALVRAGFVSDCDEHDGTCDIDPISSISCLPGSDSYSCIINI